MAAQTTCCLEAPSTQKHTNLFCDYHITAVRISGQTPMRKEYTKLLKIFIVSSVSLMLLSLISLQGFTVHWATTLKSTIYN